MEHSLLELSLLWNFRSRSALNCFKYGSESYRAWKLFVERRFHGSESSMERKFLEHSLLRSKSSTGAKVPRSESSWNIRSSGANIPRNESSRGAKVLSACGLFGEKSTENFHSDMPGWTFRCRISDLGRPECILTPFTTKPDYAFNTE